MKVDKPQNCRLRVDVVMLPGDIAKVHLDIHGEFQDMVNIFDVLFRQCDEKHVLMAAAFAALEGAGQVIRKPMN